MAISTHFLWIALIGTACTSQALWTCTIMLFKGGGILLTLGGVGMRGLIIARWSRDVGVEAVM